jgi:leucyl-tRNA synthetase
MHKTIKKVTFDIDNLKANTAIAAMMSLVNEMASKGCNKAELKTLTILLNPFAPHVTEEMWQTMNFGGMVNEAKWPTFDEEKTKENNVEIVLQVMGKVRSRMTIAVDMPKDEVIASAKQDEKIAELIAGKTIKKEIYVPGKLVNFVAI